MICLPLMVLRIFEMYFLYFGSWSIDTTCCNSVLSVAVSVSASVIFVSYVVCPAHEGCSDDVGCVVEGCHDSKSIVHGDVIYGSMSVVLAIPIDAEACDGCPWTDADSLSAELD